METCNILQGVFDPLKGFMSSKDYRSVVDNMHLTSNEIWTLPVTLDVPLEKINEVEQSENITLIYKDKIIATLQTNDVFEVDQRSDVIKQFKTNDLSHPGVAYEMNRSSFRVGGDITLVSNDWQEHFSPSPIETKQHFNNLGWKKIASFQTRNPPHRAHEYLQRIALEVSDGLFIQPLVGWKRKGDFTPVAVMGAYELIEETDYLGTIGGLYLLKEKLTEPFILTNCDTILEADYSEFIKWHSETGSLLTIIGSHKEISVPYGVLSMNEGVFDQMVEKPKRLYPNAQTHKRQSRCNERVSFAAL